jgi:hypothetical protein
VQKLYFCTGQPGDAAVQKIQFPHSGTAVKPYPAETFRSADDKLLSLLLLPGKSLKLQERQYKK